MKHLDPRNTLVPLVHNHGSEDGPGQACQERLIGDCMIKAIKVQALREAITRLKADHESDWYCRFRLDQYATEMEDGSYKKSDEVAG